MQCGVERNLQLTRILYISQTLRIERMKARAVRRNNSVILHNVQWTMSLSKLELQLEIHKSRVDVSRPASNRQSLSLLIALINTHLKIIVT